MRNDITLRGKWMYSREVIPQMVRLVRSGLIDLAQFELTEFGLVDVNEALAHARTNARPFQLTALTMP